VTLHNNEDAFLGFIIDTSEYLGIEDYGIVEKDYYVTLFLKHLLTYQPNLVFKGGTCLSKVYKLINRFSEDIDITLFDESNTIGRGKRKRFKESILAVINDIGLSLVNPDSVQSKRDFNEYQIKYTPYFNDSHANPVLLIETSVFIKSYPINTLPISSMIYDYLVSCNDNDSVTAYELQPFGIDVQSLERTFIDKVFALVDYSLVGKVEKHSRHVYDIHKILPFIVFNDNLKLLIAEVFLLRKQYSTGRATDEGVNLQYELTCIAEEHAYQQGYETKTKPFLFEVVEYCEALESIKVVIRSQYFDVNHDSATKTIAVFAKSTNF